MKIELSPNQNTLTIDDVVYEAKIAIPKGDCRQCSFENKLTRNCHHPLLNPCCIPINREDSRSIIWVKKYEN